MARRNGARGTKKGEREEVAARQRAAVDVTAVIHLSVSLPNAPLGETQSCVTPSESSQHAHTFTHTQKKDMFMILDVPVHAHTGLHVLGQWYDAGRGKSVHTVHHYTATCTSTNHNRRRQTVTHVFLLT